MMTWQGSRLAATPVYLLTGGWAGCQLCSHGALNRAQATARCSVAALEPCSTTVFRITGYRCGETVGILTRSLYSSTVKLNEVHAGGHHCNVTVQHDTFWPPRGVMRGASDFRRSRWAHERGLPKSVNLRQELSRVRVLWDSEFADSSRTLQV